MPVYVFAIVNAVLAALVVGAIVGMLVWSMLTQHRDPGCAEVRLRLRPRRPQTRVKPLDLGARRFERSEQETVLG